MSRRITGSVYWIGNGRRTSTAVEAKAAFSDPDQAAEQVFFAETRADAAVRAEHSGLCAIPWRQAVQVFGHEVWHRRGIDGKEEDVQINGIAAMIQTVLHATERHAITLLFKL